MKSDYEAICYATVSPCKVVGGYHFIVYKSVVGISVHLESMRKLSSLWKQTDKQH